MTKRLLLFISVVFSSLSVFATHNRAGEITYQHISGLTYEITVTTYTKASSTQADRCELTVKFGDGTSQTVVRTNGTSITGCTHGGVNIGNDIKKNLYVTTHTFPSTGSYTISMEDPNRNENILNIPYSVNVVFYIESELIITSTSTPNNSPVLTNPPVDIACLRRVYEHNPGAVDQDLAINGFSDSLSYELVSCLGEDGDVIAGFVQPDQVSSGTNNVISIDPVTGTLTWEAPQQIGEYNVAILITEWRKMANDQWVKVGTTLRDMQIDVYDCGNEPPVIEEVVDTCVTAGDTLLKVINASDPDVGNEVTLSATGEPFLVMGNQAEFSEITGTNSVSSNFKWNPECSHVRYNPYYVVFRAVDGNSFDASHIELTDYYTWYIDVLAPQPTNEIAGPQGSGITLSWDYNFCDNQSGYEIYRRVDSAGYVPSACETGVPNGLGYTQIATIDDPLTTTYLDDNNGNGLNHGQKYCFMVYATFEDGSESYATYEFCSELNRDVPVITHVSINETDQSSGSDTIRWAKPTELDLSIYTGPYQYVVYKRNALGQFDEVAQLASNSDLNLMDTVYVDDQINTEDDQFFYRIGLFNNGSLVGYSPVASSIYLSNLGLDNRIRLSWTETVSWTNTEYVVYKESAPNSGVFDILDTVSESIYIDSGLVNGNEYCYKVQSIGAYTTPGFQSPLYNFSQISCGIAEDNQAPCSPVNLNLDADCEIGARYLTWTNPESVCDSVDDVIGYRIYRKPFIDGEFVLLAEINDPSVTEYDFEVSEDLSIAGCYAVTAIDSFQNESEMSASACADNCPIYELPNVFTPGGDGRNDYFVPFPYRQVLKIDLTIFNRWGDKVFETDDPDIKWDGTNMFNGDQALADGVFFYVCTVYEWRLEGIVPRELKGTITLINQIEKYPTD